MTIEIVERTIILPENQTFLIRELELKNNKGVIHTHDKAESYSNTFHRYFFEKAVINIPELGLSRI